MSGLSNSRRRRYGRLKAIEAAIERTGTGVVVRGGYHGRRCVGCVVVVRSLEVPENLKVGRVEQTGWREKMARCGQESGCSIDSVGKIIQGVLCSDCLLGSVARAG